MDENRIMKDVLNEINRSVLSIRSEQIGKLAKAMDRERRIFCDGAGRSRLQAEGFAMRLTQMGFKANVVGEPTTPAITGHDILLICSGSGETPVLVEHAAKAQTVGALIIVITTNEHSPLGETSDFNILIEASSKKALSSASIQPMGSLFEQSVGILFDIIVLKLMEIYGISSEEMYKNHSNLE